MEIWARPGDTLHEARSAGNSPSARGKKTDCAGRLAMALRPKLIVSTILGTLAYLGLAILGLGGFAAFFSHPALIALTVVLFLLSAVAPFSAGNLSPGEHEDRGNRWVLAAFGVISLLLGYVPAYDDRTELWTIDGDA